MTCPEKLLMSVVCIIMLHSIMTFSYPNALWQTEGAECLYTCIHTHTHTYHCIKSKEIFHGPSLINAEWNEVIQSYLEKCAAVIISDRTKSLIFNIKVVKQKYSDTFYYVELTECILVRYDHTCYVKGVLEKCVMTWRMDWWQFLKFYFHSVSIVVSKCIISFMSVRIDD